MKAYLFLQRLGMKLDKMYNSFLQLLFLSPWHFHRDRKIPSYPLHMQPNADLEGSNKSEGGNRGEHLL